MKQANHKELLWEKFIHQITSITISSSNTIKITHDYWIKKYDLLIKTLLLTSEFKTLENTLSKLLHLNWKSNLAQRFQPLLPSLKIGTALHVKTVLVISHETEQFTRRQVAEIQSIDSSAVSWTIANQSWCKYCKSTYFRKPVVIAKI